MFSVYIRNANYQLYYFYIVVVITCVESFCVYQQIFQRIRESVADMKAYVFIALMAFIAIGSAVFVPPRPGHKKPFLGEKECTYGPTFWCQNLTAAADCKAVKHCIQTVWVHKTLPPDTSSVCQTCLDMVKQARDQLLSNDTQELIKEVFEGSCALLHLKPVVEECDKICDNYIPELIDTLASQMNPQVVCSVAGLCNSEKVHKLLKEAGEKIDTSEVEVTKPDYCGGCRLFSTYLETKFNKMSRDEVLHGLLNFCGNMGTYSDACSNIMITYFNEIYEHLENNLNADEVCLLSGDCRAQFHQHAKVEITPMSHIGYVKVIEKEDDLPCELCEQLVRHLRDVLIANTTEDEFERVLNGLCKQTGKFTQECLSLVSQYYREMYDFLVNNLNSTDVCRMIGTCNPSLDKGGIIAPLLPVSTAKKALAMSEQNKPLVDITPNVESSTINILQPVDVAQQLPIDLLMPPHTQVLYNKEVCAFCIYFLHYVQEAITNPKTEEQIKSVIDQACQKLPDSVNNTCIEFVDTYEPAMVAILAQDIDPSQVCPLIRACPSGDAKSVEIFMEVEGNSKCPLCLVAVTQLESLVKDKKTEENIKAVLNKLCDHFESNLRLECQDFVETYTNELVEMLIADLEPAEVCQYLKLCDGGKPARPSPSYTLEFVGGDIDTNVIPDNTINGKLVTAETKPMERPQCVLCEFVMKEIEDQLQNKKSQEDIEKVVHGICNTMPPSIKKDCNNFVNQYADVVIQLLIQALKPDEICSMMKLCNNQLDNMKDEILACPVCEMTVDAMEKILTNPKVSHDVQHVLEKTCRGLPNSYWSKCEEIVDEYGVEIFKEITQHSPNRVCKLVGLCSQDLQTGNNRCTYGPSYWCKSQETAIECNAQKHCEEQVWGGSHPQNREIHLVGADRCTWGPGYWCVSEENADSCGNGARTHCESKVWGGPRPGRSPQLGRNPCTHGPGFWCKSQANADSCGKGARTHCETKVWGKNPPA